MLCSWLVSLVCDSMPKSNIVTEDQYDWGAFMVKQARTTERAKHFVQVRQRVVSAMAQVHKVRDRERVPGARPETVEAEASKWPSSP